MIDVLWKNLHKLSDFIFALGYFSEIIIVIIVIYLLQKDLINVLIYIIFFLLDGYINTILKGIIREPRPPDYVKYLYSEHTSRVKTIYGMPSGHSQNVFFSLTYLFLTAKEPVYWIQICLGLSALMAYERWTFHNHTLLQLFAGAIVGIIFGWGAVYFRDFVVRPLIKKDPRSVSKKQ